jgi:hypothetical protein
MSENPDARPSSGFHAELLAAGRSPAEADEIQRELALTAIRRHPFDTGAGVLSSLREMYTDVARGLGSEEFKIQLAARRSLFPRRVTLVGLFAGAGLRRAWWLLSLGGLALALWFVLADARTRVAALAVIAVWLSVACATAVLHGGQIRYSAALAPLVWLLGSLGAAALTQSIVAAVITRREPSAPSSG